MDDGVPPTATAGLGVAKIVFFVIAAAAPLTGTLGALPIAIGFGNGAGAALAFVVAGLLLIIFSIGYSRMSRHIAEAGAFYAYVREGLGRPLGTGAALVAVTSYAAIQLALYGLFGFFCDTIIPLPAGAHLPWWSYSAGALWLTHGLALRRADLNAILLGTLMVLEMGIVLVVVAAVAWQGGPEGMALSAFDPRHVRDPGFGIAIMFALACFVGFEATAIYAPEARDPARTIPRATYLSVLVITLFFATAAWAISCAFGPGQIRQAALADPGGLWFFAAGTRIGYPAALAMKLFLLSSIFASILAFHNALARYLLVVACDGLIWRALGACDPRTGVPVAACRFQTMVSAAGIVLAVALGIDPYTQLFGWMSAFATIGILLLQIMVSAAVVRYFWLHPHHRSVWVTGVAPVTALAGLLVVMAIMLVNLPALAGAQDRALYALPVIQLLLLAIGTVAGASWMSPAPSPAAGIPFATTFD